MKRRAIDFQALDGVVSEVRQLHENGYDCVGQWNLAQTCRHLAIGVRGTMDGMGFAMPFWMKFARPVIKWRLFRTRRIPEGIKAPPVLVPERGTGDNTDRADEAAAVAELAEAVHRLAQHRGPVHPSPVTGELTYDEWIQFHCIHAAHHLSFLLPRGGEPPAGEC